MLNCKSKLNDSIVEIESILKVIEEDYSVAKTKSSQLDQLKNDIEHEIELDKLSGSQMMLKYKELQATLRLRRKYKDECEYYIGFRESLNLNIIENARKRINKIENQKCTRKYSRRIKYELRQEILNEIEEI